MEQHTEHKPDEVSRAQHKVETMLSSSKWLLVIFSAGLIVALVVYAIFFCGKTMELVSFVNPWSEHTEHGEEDLLLGVLSLVDIAMIAFLIYMIITGLFVGKASGNSGALKVKMAMSLVGVSSIHLLKTFIDANNSSWDLIWKQGAIHGMFVVGVIVMALTDKIMHSNKH
jgi:uncharacterized protein (TIGR00645 family)